MSGKSFEQRGGKFGLLALIVAAVATCAGDGTGLDEFGNPRSPDAPELTPSLSSIQRNVLTPLCTQCHTRASAPLGLALDEGLSWANLVNVPSVEMPSLVRVAPGEPEISYLVWKIEGRVDITGGRMPLGLPPLSAEQIVAIRTWIEQGAAAD